jgi:hypothetical protein
MADGRPENALNRHLPSAICHQRAALQSAICHPFFESPIQKTVSLLARVWCSNVAAAKSGQSGQQSQEDLCSLGVV